MGGIVIFTTVMILLFSFYKDLNSIRSIIIASLLILICGTLDDIIGLKWHSKLFFEFLAALIVIFHLSEFFTEIQLFGLVLPYPLNYIILLVFTIGVINSINLLDGLDGLASGFSLLVFAMFFIFANLLGNQLLLILSAGFAGSLLGFLKYNAYPAKVFLGDTGSLLLGFFLLTCSLLISIELYHSVLDLTFLTIVLGVPIIDTLRVMVLRLLDKQNPFNPDKRHFHHVIYDVSNKHKITVFIVQSFTIIFLIISLIYFKGFQDLGIFLFLFFALLLVGIKKILITFKGIGIFLSMLHVRLVNILPKNIKSIYQQLILPSVTVLMGGVLILLFPIKTTLERNELTFLIVLGLFVSSLAYLHFKRTGEIAGIYVLLNIAIFLILTHFSKSLHTKIHSQLIVIERAINIIFAITLLTIAVYMTLREKIFSNYKALLTGIDLTIILLISVLFFINNIIGYQQLGYLDITLFQAFIIYLFYKIISRIKDPFAKYIYAFSFILPFLSISIMLLF